ncbi:peptidase family M13-domain-containing protein [Mycena albidolilacea]|uniref:Peptidase family M13-domain-containing protein n=1 Tax=Mycena albidolilacea TaxID=1033008 RepID=A0AAD7AIT5_9AGAR|nr:peptidase family M13-domain-containing protein [Mycena albidolilacea]
MASLFNISSRFEDVRIPPPIPMVDRVPRQQEAAPLLGDSDYDSERDEILTVRGRPTLLERINSTRVWPMATLLLLSSIFVGLFVSQYTESKRRERDPGEQACLTSECLTLSNSILSSLDESQDPCEDFYKFANGGWIAAHPLPAEKGSFGHFEALAQANQRIIQHFLETPSATSSFGTASNDELLLQKLRDFYWSCLNTRRLNGIGAEPLIRFVQKLKQLLRGQGFEAADGMSALVSEGLTAAIAFLHSRGVDALFSFAIEGDVGVDASFMIPWLYQGKLGLPSKEYYKETSIVEVYQDVVERLLIALEPESKRTETAHRLAKQVIKFETRLANASLDAHVYQDPFAIYNRLPLSNLTKSLPQIKFSEYFDTFAPDRLAENVVITCPEYLSSLSEILNETSAEVIEAYLVVRAALTLSPNLGTTSEPWKAQHTLLETLTGIKKGAGELSWQQPPRAPLIDATKTFRGSIGARSGLAYWVHT